MSNIHPFSSSLHGLSQAPIKTSHALTLEGMWRRICRLATGIFHIFKPRSETKKLFNDHEIQLLHNAQTFAKELQRKKTETSFTHRNQKPMYHRNRKDICESTGLYSSLAQTSNLDRAIASGFNDRKLVHISNIDNTYVAFDESLESMREFLRNLVMLVVDIINKQYIQTQIESFQSSSNSIPSVVKSITSLIKEKSNVKTLSKVEHFERVLCTTFKERLDDIVFRTIQINATNIVDFISERFADLISHMDFPQTFDKIWGCLGAQIEGIIAAHKACEEHRSLLAKAKAAIAIPAYTLEAIEIKKQAIKYLETTSLHSTEEAFLAQIFVEEFSRHPSCNESTRKIIKETYSQLHPIAVKKSIEKVIYEELSQVFISIVLPIQERTLPSGEIEYVDSFAQLWDRLYLPEEFNEIIKQAEEIARDFIVPETISLLGSIKKPTKDIFKDMFRTAAQDVIKKYLVDVVRMVYESLAPTDQLNIVMAETLLPMINNALIRCYISIELGYNIKTIAPLLTDLLNAAPDCRNEIQKILQEKLVELILSKKGQFNGKNYFVKDCMRETTPSIEFADISEKEWYEFTLPLITYLEKDFIRKRTEEESSLISVSETEAYLKAIYEAPYPEKSNPIFGEIVMNLVADLGEFNHLNSFSSFLKKLISLVLTDATQELSRSHEYLLDLIIPSLNESVLSKEYLEPLFKENQYTPSQHIPEKLNHQINILSRLAYDIILTAVEKQGRIAKFATKLAIGSDSQEAEKVLTKIYNKVFNNEFLNHNLIAQLFNEVFRGIADSAETISSDK